MIDYFGTAHFFLAETGFSITAVQEETVYLEWINTGRQKIVVQMKEHMARLIVTLHIKQTGKYIDLRQFHHRADGKIGYHFLPYAEDGQGRWRENLGVGLWQR
ncbi:hypothetical protein [Paenibacillus sp. OSY-SE]|uniref:hypothetical protein n=1 Tax=Paenibacillus sp. OSY-SE TaxID=1196323 RepID=UPI0012F8B249|nr:hypothetical protein [Paenibacillus sp. OSY-SE]